MTRAVIVLALLTGAAVQAAPSVAASRGPCVGPRFATDGVPPAVEHRHARRVVRCVFWHVVPGQAGHALRIADRESRFDDEAYNSGSGASGLFQHLRRYWPGRARALPDRYFRRSPSAFNARANAWAAALMVRRGGWGPWS